MYSRMSALSSTTRIRAAAGSASGFATLDAWRASPVGASWPSPVGSHWMGLAHVGLGGPGGRRARARRVDVHPVRRQVRAGAEGDRDREARADAHAARRRDRAAVQSDQRVDEREADAGALVRARPGSLDAMKALEEPRQLVVGDAHPGVFDHDLGVVAGRVQRDADAALERELEGVRQQVRDDLLPHSPVDEDRTGKVLDARDVEREPRAGHRRAEHARELACGHGQIGRDVVRLDPPGLDARKIEQRVHQLAEPQGASMRELDRLARPRGQRGRTGSRGRLAGGRGGG